MLIDRTHLGWGLASAAAFAAATVGYAASVAGPREGSGGSAAGLAFGLLALAAMIFAGLLAVRKKFPGLRLGSAQFWLRGHIWLGLLSVPFAFYHASFRFGGALETALMLVFLAVIASGVYGLALQQVLPRMLKVRVPLETFPQQIPYLLEKMKEEGQLLIKDLEGAAKKAAPTAAAGASGVAAGKPAQPAAAASADGASGDATAKIAAAKAAAASSKPTTPKTEAAPSAEAAKEKKTPAALDVAAKLAAARAAAKQAPGGADSARTVAAKSVASAKPDAAAIAAAAKASALAAAAKATAARAAANKTPADAAGAGAVSSAGASPNAESDWSLKRPVQTAVGAPPSPDGPMPRLDLLSRFFQDKVIPFLTSDPRAAARENLASENYARMAFANLAVALPARALAAIERLEEIVAERRQFLVQVRIQSWLRAWLLVHVPLSAALFVLAAVHVVVALRVVPFF